MSNFIKSFNFHFQISFLVLFSFIIFFTGIGDYGLLDKDEPRYAGCALEMLENNNWIIPKFNFQDRFDKPALFYWLIIIAYKIFGINAFTSRLPSGICAVLCVLFTCYVARVVFGKKTAFISGIILASSIEFILLGRRAATDMALCFFFSASLYSLFLGYYIKDFKIKILAGVVSGLSVLIKGPVGLILPLVILTLFLALRKSFDLRHVKIYFVICLFGILVSLPWYLAVHNATGGQFTKEFFFEHNLKRFTSVVGEHPGPFWFYVPVLLSGFMPWTIFFLCSLRFYVSRFFKKIKNKFISFLMVWFLTVFIFFSVSTTKLPTYIILLFPAISLITANWIRIAYRKNRKLIKVIFTVLLAIIIPSVVCGIYLISKWKIALQIKEILILKMVILFGLLLLFYLISLFSAKKIQSLISGVAISIILPFVFGLNLYLVQYYKYSHMELRRFAELAKSKGVEEIISFGMYRPSLVYYSRTKVNFDDKRKQAKAMKADLHKHKKIFLIGHSSDISKYSFIRQNFQILGKGKKYFVAEQH